MTSRARRWRRALVPLAGVALLVLAGCGPENGQNSLRPKGPRAEKINDLFIPVVVVATVIFVLVTVGTIYAIVRFRQRPGRSENVRQIHGSTPLEIGWTILPALILAVIAVPTVRTIFDLEQDPGDDALVVNVTGKQWWWQFEYPEQGIVTSTEMHIPAGRDVKLNLRACEGPEDAPQCNVIHSFWVPELSGKRDVVPGRTNTLVIKADEPGTYLGQCAEYCGLAHADMRFRVVAMTEDDFEEWADDQSGPPRSTPSPAVQELISNTYGCTGCHFFDEPNRTNFGPNLTHLASRATFAGGTLALDREDLIRWVLDAPSLVPMESEKCLLPPPATCVGMPSFVRNLPAGREPMPRADAEQIADFLLSLE